MDCLITCLYRLLVVTDPSHTYVSLPIFGSIVAVAAVVVVVVVVVVAVYNVVVVDVVVDGVVVEGGR